jgi:hypothetical protein
MEITTSFAVISLFTYPSILNLTLLEKQVFVNSQLAFASMNNPLFSS